MKIWIKKYAGLGIVAVAVFLLTYYWGKISGIGNAFLMALAPIIGGIVIAYIVNIPMQFYERTVFARMKGKVLSKIRRAVCMLLSFITVAALIAAVVVLILPELIDCINLIIKVVPPFVRDTYLELEQKYEISNFLSQNVASQFTDIKDMTDIASKVVSWFFTGFGDVVGSLFSLITATFSTVFSVIMSFVFAIYLLYGKETIFNGIGRVSKAYLKEKTVNRLGRVFHVADQSFHRFIVGQCAEAVILGVLCIIGMHIFDFPYATMIGTLIGFTALIPIAGAYIGAAIGALMILTVSSWLEALLFVVFIVVLQQLEGNLIYPKVVGASIGLPSVWVMATVTIAATLGGVFAILLGVPLVATAYRLLRSDVRSRLDGPNAVYDDDDDEEIEKAKKEKKEKKSKHKKEKQCKKEANSSEDKKD